MTRTLPLLLPLALMACQSAPPPESPPTQEATASPSPTTTPPKPPDSPEPAQEVGDGATPAPDEDTPDEEAQDACPEGMVYVEVEHCDRIEQACLREGRYDRRGFYPICREFARERRCVGERRLLRFCIDRYEYPNREGAHPPAVVNAWDAAALCEGQGKRLCWSREWTAACEGRAHTPFPYGYERAADSSVCRNDLPKDQPTKRIWSKHPRVLDAELRRLDGSVPAGSMPGCVSDLGVYDMTGNFSEWVFIERPHWRVSWAGTKGGWWGRVRNNCRSTGTGHPERFRYFGLTARCCADPSPEATGAPLPPASPPLWTPPPVPRATRNNPDPGWPGWSPDYEAYSGFRERHGPIRERYMRRHHPTWTDPLKATAEP